MRILRIAQKIYPDVKGGGPYHVHAMSRDQAAMGHDVTVLTVRQDESLPHFEERDGYTIVRYDPAATLLGNDICSGIAQFLIDAEKFDVMHAHSHLYFATNLAALRRAIGEIPLAITNHGLYSQNAPEWIFDLYLRSLGRWTFNRADVVFCYTETDRQRVHEFGVSSPIEVVSNGIDTERFQPDGSKSDLLTDDQPVVLFVGRLVEGKRPSVVVQAFSSVVEEFPNAKLCFCGEGPLREELEKQVVNLGLEDSAKFLGQVPYDEMPQVYRSGDVMVLPSRAEGVPRTVLEAMASGLPVVVSNLEQVTEILGDGGRAVSVGDGERIAETVCTMLTQDSYVDGEQTVRNHRWVDTVERTTETLESIIN